MSVRVRAETISELIFAGLMHPVFLLTGKGQSVGLFQFDGFYLSDIASYAALIGLSNPPKVIVVPINGGVSVPGSWEH